MVSWVKSDKCYKHIAIYYITKIKQYTTFLYKTNTLLNSILTSCVKCTYSTTYILHNMNNVRSN